MFGVSCVFLAFASTALGAVPRYTSYTCEHLGADIYGGFHLIEQTLPDELYVISSIKFFTSVDMNETSEVEDVACGVLGNDVPSAVQYLRDTEILDTFVRRLYEYFVLLKDQVWPMLQNAPIDPLQPLSEGTTIASELFDTLDRMGFFDLDKEGVEEMKDWIWEMAPEAAPSFISDVSVHSENEALTNEEGCEILEGLVERGVALLLMIDPSFEILLTNMTGLPSSEFGEPLCAIASSSSTDDLTDVLQDMGIIHNLLSYGLFRIRGLRDAFNSVSQKVFLSDDEFANTFIFGSKAKHRQYLQGVYQILSGLNSYGMID